MTTVKSNCKLRILSFVLVVILCVAAILPLNAFAAESSNEVVSDKTTNISVLSVTTDTLGTGRSYLGNFTFKNTNTGASRTMNGNQMKLSLAWKQADDWTPVNLNVKVIRTYTGTVAYEGTFDIKNDSNGADSDGYYYYETDYFPINYGSDYHIYYDVVTAPDYFQLPFGDYRSASVHTWVDLK